MGGYTMLALKYDIARDIRRMMFDDGSQANGHAKHLISTRGTGCKPKFRNSKYH